MHSCRQSLIGIVIAPCFVKGLVRSIRTVVFCQIFEQCHSSSPASIGRWRSQSSINTRSSCDLLLCSKLKFRAHILSLNILTLMYPIASWMCFISHPVPMARVAASGSSPARSRGVHTDSLHCRSDLGRSLIVELCVAWAKVKIVSLGHTQNAAVH